MTRNSLPVLTVAALMLGAPAARATDPSSPPAHRLPKSSKGNLVVGLCDGTTSMEVPGVKEGESLTPTQAKAVSSQLMATWKRKNPNARWEEPVEVASAPTSPPAPNSQQAGAPAAPQSAQVGHTYGAFTERDEKIWKASTQAFIDQGNHIFHDAKQLGGTIAVSCDMCHPNAANTHPETYPKYQVQLGRVALLRDMINWCIENPVRGKPLRDDDPKLKALEAYLYSQRRGVPLEYGKH